MAVRTREELLESVRNRIGDQNDDETIAFLEDITDTINDLEEKAKGDGTDWESKYKENDKEWRKKYTERFYSPEPKDESDEIETDDKDEKEKNDKPKTFNDLFTSK